MENKLRVAPGFCFLAALALLLLPMQWGMGAMLAALTHELFHILAVILCGGQVRSVSLGGSGALIHTSPLTAGKEALCALAGPVGSFLMLLLAEHFPEAALCGLVQGAYNLLPVYPLDGGRIMHCLFSKPVCVGIEVFILTLFSGLCAGAALWAPELAVIGLLFLWIPVFQRKISCKEPKLAVQ